MSQNGENSQVYTIGELAEATGMSRRGIHFYMKEKLLPPPQGTGRNARYTDEHLLRLLVILHMRDETNWRLEGIRKFLEPLTMDALLDLVKTFEEVVQTRDLPPGTPRFSRGPRDIEARGAPPGDEAPMAPRGIMRESLSIRFGIGKLRKKTESEETAPAPAPKPADTDTWERVRISDDMEIHYRSRTGDAGFLKRIRKLIDFARKRFSK